MLGKLVNSGKISVDWVNKKVGYENLISMNARGAPAGVVQTGVYVDSSDPNPALRVKFTWPQLMGPLAPRYLFISTNLQVVVDVRKKINPGQSPGAPNFMTNAVAGPKPNFLTNALPTAGPTPIIANAAGSDRPWWDRPSILFAAATVIVTASIATDILTCGLDSEKDLVTGPLALRLATMAAR